MGIMKWLNIQWYKHLFKRNTGIRNILCRIRNHPNGVVWFNFTGTLEPDMRCVDCGEDLG